MAGHRRGHAQGGVAIVIVGADQPTGELAQGIELLGEHLSGRDDGEGIAPVFLLNSHDFVVHLVQNLIPLSGLPGLVPMLAYQWFQTTPGGIEQFMLEDTLQAEFTAVDIGLSHAA